MKYYFIGHKDSPAINEYLNNLSEDSADFQVVYQLRKMGEEFNDGMVTFQEISRFSSLSVSDYAESFIKQMKCWTFYTAICHIAKGQVLTPFEMKVRNEIEHPSFIGPASTIIAKFQRIWRARWKHPLVFNEPFLARIITFVWSVIRMERIVKDLWPESVTATTPIKGGPIIK